MCALKTPEELHKDVCVPTVSTDYGLTGEQKEKNIRWFPTVRLLQRTLQLWPLLHRGSLHRFNCPF